MKKLIYAFLMLGLNFSLFSQEKLQIALMDFGNTGGLSQQESVTLANRLRTMLVKTESFVVLERGIMQDILEEQGFQQTGCTTSECAVEAGKLLNVQKMINGSIGKIGQTYTVDIALIDVETSEIEKTFYEDYRGEIDGLLEMMESIANQISSTILEKEPEKKEIITTYIVRINSTPERADIFINNLKVGVTPFSAKFAEGKELNIVVKKNKYKDWKKDVKVDKNLNISATLELFREEKIAQTAVKEESESSTWYYWVAGGAAVIGGVAYYILATEQDDEKSSIFPLPPGRPAN